MLADLSGRYAPAQWAKAAIAAYHAHNADRIVAETNQGGEMVEATLRTVERDIPVTLVRASRGKVARAEPVAALYEQGRIHHVGAFPKLEDQMCAFVAGDSGDLRRALGVSPDRVDALVWAFTELLVERALAAGFVDYYRGLAVAAPPVPDGSGAEPSRGDNRDDATHRPEGVEAA